MSEEKAVERNRKAFERYHKKFGKKRAIELLALIGEATSKKGG